MPTVESWALEIAPLMVGSKTARRLFNELYVYRVGAQMILTPHQMFSTQGVNYKKETSPALTERTFGSNLGSDQQNQEPKNPHFKERKHIKLLSGSS